MASERWYEDASCRGLPEPEPEIFFPPRDKALYKKTADLAKAYCYGGSGKPPCPVRLECLWDALLNDEQHGIWGGLSHRERNALVRKWNRQYKSSMTLKEYVFQERRKTNGSKG